MRSLNACVRVVWGICVICLLPDLLVRGQEGTSIWQSLPSETVAAVRIPNGRAVLDAVRETKFGAVMLTEKRQADIVAVCEKYGDDEWVEFLGLLKQYDLSGKQIMSMFAGESGYAVTLNEGADDDALFLGLAWMQPGDEQAAKFLEVVAKAIEEQDSELSVAREDIDIAGQQVMQLRLPSVDTEYTEEFILPDDYDDLDEEEQSDAYDRAEEAFEASAVETISYRSVLVCQIDDRLLLGHQFMAPSEDEAEVADQRLSDLMASVLSALASGGSDGFAPRLSDNPIVARTLSGDGLPIMELLGDIRPLIDVARKAADDEADADRWIRLLGADNLGAFAMRQTAEGSNWTTMMSMSMPSPRSGLTKLFDQEMLAIDPPQWVPSSVVRYFQVGFDLGVAYETIKEEVQREFPERTAAGFVMAETQVENFAQTSLPELLSSLGNRHTIMSFGLETVEQSDDEAEGGDNVNERMAFVWQVADEEVWSRLLKVIAPFAGMAPGTEAAEEQGFSGWRMRRVSNEAGLFLGKGHLVVGVGSGVVESVLSALNNPPSGSNALRGSEVFARASDLVDLEPAMFVEITDNDRYLQMVFTKLQQQFSQFEGMIGAFAEGDESSDGSFVFDLLRAVMPKDEELPGLMGVSVGRTEVNDDGLFGQSIQEMPAK